LENFAKRLRNPVITRFISILIQDIHIGNKDMQSTLRLMGNEVWEMRKNTVRKFGEEASTKLMIPIMLMFIAVLLIVIAPVLMAFKDI
jgi:tight adherence protein C